MKFNLKKCMSVALAVTMCAGILAGCSKGGDSSGAKKDTIVYGVSTSPSGVFNPVLTDSIYDDAVCNMVYNSLFSLDKDQQLKPELAEKYSVSEDGKELTFNIKNDVKWSDGEALTAKDVVFTFTSLGNKGYQGEIGDFVSKIKGANDYKEGKADKIAGIEAVDDTTVKITFDDVYGPALTNLGTVGIIPEHVWSKVPVEKWKEAKDLMAKPVGSGPYVLKSFTEGQDAKFEKNDKYFEGQPKTANIVFKVVNEDTIASDLKNGNIDVANVSNLKKADREDLEKQNFKLYTHPNNLFQYMGMNYRNEIFKDKKVREAIITGIDRKGMVEKLLEGNGTVTNTPMLTSSWAFPKDDKSLKTYDYSTEKAKKLLEEAGYTMKDGVMEKNGKKLEFKLDVPTGNAIREQAAQIIQENLKAVGIKIELNKMEFPALMAKVVENHDFDLYMMGNNLPQDPDLTAYWSKASVSDVKGESGWNIVGFANDELEGILKEGTASYDIEKRKASYKKFAEYMNEEIPWAYLFEQKIVIATNPKLAGFEPSVFRDFEEPAKWELGN